MNGSGGSSLVILIGLPGSGKSTFARSLLTTHPDSILISTDGIRSQLFGDESTQGSWLKIWLEVRRQFQEAVRQIEVGQASLAVYDATNAVRKQRRQAIHLARKMGFSHIVGLWINTPLSVCLARNQARSCQVPEATILRMDRRLQGAPPTIVEGLDELRSLSLDGAPDPQFLQINVGSMKSVRCVV
ncbi:AAA family ATPase [Phormidesmis sp. 146-12]